MNCPQKNELSKYNKKMYFVENLFAFCYVLLRSFFICEKEHVYEKYRLHQLYVEQYTWNSCNLNMQCSLSKLQLRNLMDIYFETMLCRFLVRCTMWITWSEFDRFENNIDLNAKHYGVVQKIVSNCTKDVPVMKAFFIEFGRKVGLTLIYIPLWNRYKVKRNGN